MLGGGGVGESVQPEAETFFRSGASGTLADFPGRFPDLASRIALEVAVLRHWPTVSPLDTDNDGVLIELSRQGRQKVDWLSTGLAAAGGGRSGGSGGALAAQTPCQGYVYKHDKRVLSAVTRKGNKINGSSL